MKLTSAKLPRTRPAVPQRLPGYPYPVDSTFAADRPETIYCDQCYLNNLL